MCSKSDASQTSCNRTMSYSEVLWKLEFKNASIKEVWCWIHCIIWYSSAVFPKVRSADLFWSARVSNLVCEKKKLLLILYFKSIYHKICNFFFIKFHFLVHRKNFMDYVVRQIFFNVLWSASQKSLGNTALASGLTKYLNQTGY
jgi:hypothetical protein